MYVSYGISITIPVPQSPNLMNSAGLQKVFQNFVVHGKGCDYGLPFRSHNVLFTHEVLHVFPRLLVRFSTRSRVRIRRRIRRVVFVVVVVVVSKVVDQLVEVEELPIHVVVAAQQR